MVSKVSAFLLSLIFLFAAIWWINTHPDFFSFTNQAHFLPEKSSSPEPSLEIQDVETNY